jgi:tetrapyrrole methylase family protein/MazG family protein
MSEEAGDFSIEDVADGICKKLVLRHPHIFSGWKVSGSQEVLDNWDEIKKLEKGQTSAVQTLRSVPAVLPALMRSAKVQKRAAKVGFDYPNLQMALDDLERELAELKEAISRSSEDDCQLELGDLIFSAVNVSRFLHVDAELCLTLSCNKFIDRFEHVEHLARERNIDMKHESIERLNELWNEAKRLAQSSEANQKK